MKFVKLIFLTFLLQGCGFGDTKEVSMPLYNECLAKLQAHIKSFSGFTSVEFTINKFDIKSEVHSFIVGAIVVRGKGEEFENHKNTVKSICLPRAMIETNRDQRGLVRMIGYYDSLRQGGDAYLDITGDRIRVFYNEGLNENAMATELKGSEN